MQHFFWDITFKNIQQSTSGFPLPTQVCLHKRLKSEPRDAIRGVQLLPWQRQGQLQSWERKHNSQAEAKGDAQLPAHSLLRTGHNAQKRSAASLGGKRIKGTCAPLHSRTARLPAQEHLWQPSSIQTCTEPMLGAGSHQLQDGQRPSAELEPPALVLQVRSTRGIRPPCLLVKPEFDKFINTAFLQGKHLHHQGY